MSLVYLIQGTLYTCIIHVHVHVHVHAHAESVNILLIAIIDCHKVCMCKSCNSVKMGLLRNKFYLLDIFMCSSILCMM